MRQSRTRLAVEALERRELMAVGDAVVLLDLGSAPGTGGNVTAEVIDGTLVIRGDGASNGIGVYEADGDSFYLESPNDQSTVNGLSTRRLSNLGETGAIKVLGVTRGIDIDMGDGDDWILVNGRALKDVKIITGAGDDSIRLGGWPLDLTPWMETWSIKYPRPATIDGNLYIDTGGGNDVLTPFANVNGDATIQMGEGDDSFLEPTYSIYGSEIRERLLAEGTRLFDLGTGEQDAGWSADWRSNAALVPKVHPDIVSALERYAAARQAGEIEPGEEWTWQQDDGDPAGRFTSDGRLQIEFTYFPGDTELIDRLQLRGLRVEHHSDGNGPAYASIRESDLALFGNLPTLGGLYLRGLMWGGRLPFEFDDARSPVDVNGDGAVHPNDALIVINALDRGNDVPLSARTDIPAGSHVDVNQDGLLTPIDALRVINALMALSNSATANSPGAAGVPQGEYTETFHAQEPFALLADEVYGDLAARRRVRTVWDGRRA